MQDINLPTNTVAFTRSDGTNHVIQVSPELRKFIREIKPGETVQVTFTESLAVEVIPAS